MIRCIIFFLIVLTYSQVRGQSTTEPQEVGYIDFKINLLQWQNKHIRVKGGFHYLQEDGGSFILRVDDNDVIIDISNLPEESREAVLDLRNFSEVPVTVTGTAFRGGVQRDQPAVKASKLDIEDASTRNSYRSRRGVVTVPELQVNPPRYLESSVAMQGRFDFLQPGREAFRLWRGVDTIEVDYSRLSVDTKRQIMSLKNFSDQSMKVSGILQPAPTSEVAFGLQATSLQIDPVVDSSQSSSTGGDDKEGGVTYAEILLNPGLYANKTETIKGGFESCDPHRKTLQIWQGGDSMEIDYRDVSPDEMDLVEKQRPFNSIVLVITGVIRAYPRAPHRFMMEAHEIALDKGS